MLTVVYCYQLVRTHPIPSEWISCNSVGGGLRVSQVSVSLHNSSISIQRDDARNVKSQTFVLERDFLLVKSCVAGWLYNNVWPLPQVVWPQESTKTIHLCQHYFTGQHRSSPGIFSDNCFPCTFYHLSSGSSHSYLRNLNSKPEEMKNNDSCFNLLVTIWVLKLL